MSDTDDTDREHELPADIIFRDAKRAMALSRGAVDQLKALKAGAASLALPVRHGFVARGDVLQELCEQAGRVGLLDEVGATVVEATIADGLDNPEAAAEPAEPQEATRQRLVPIPWSEIHSLPRREELIAGLLDRGAMSLVYGASGACKTFFAIDLCARKALGILWRGRKLDAAGVAYLAAEGGLGIVDRLDAWQTHHKVERLDGVPLYIFPEPIDLCHSDADMKLLAQRILALPHKPPVELIVVDTFSRALAGGDENHPKDMGLLVRHCDHLRFLTKAHVMGLHHTGRDENRGARGHSLLKAATDTEIELSMTDDVSKTATAKVTKQRDRAGGEVFSFRLHQVELDRVNSKGEKIKSCAILEDEVAQARAPAGHPKLSDRERLAVQCLRDLISKKGAPPPEGFDVPDLPTGVLAVSLDDWRGELFKRNVITREDDGHRQKFKRLKDGLQADKVIGVGEISEGNVIVWVVASPAGAQGSLL
jgi:hypothetical protein